MKLRHSIRGRLLLWYGLLIAAMLAGFGSTAWHLERASRLRQIDQDLQRRISVITNALKEQRPLQGGRQISEVLTQQFAPSDAARFDRANPDGYYYAVWLRDDTPVARSANAPAALPRPVVGETSPRQRGELREACLFAAPVDCVVVGRFMTGDLASLRRVAWLLTLAGGAVLGVGLAVGWWIVSQSLRPVRDITHTAAQIAKGDLSQRINTAQTESELGELAGVLNSTFARLDAAFAQQARFTSDASHELRTPLAVLLTQTQAVLARERSAAEYRDALVSNQSTAQRMRRLTESLLDLARLDAGQEPLRRVACDLSMIASDCLELIRPLADARHIAFTADLPGLKCEVDPDRITQVIMNLLTNAIQNNREHGEVSVTTLRQNEEAVLVVADNGPGISEEDLPHIFERFYRADKSRSGPTPKTGLGLAISRAIAEAHGGTLLAVSEGSGGATFRLSLPNTVSDETD